MRTICLLVFEIAVHTFFAINLQKVAILTEVPSTPVISCGKRKVPPSLTGQALLEIIT
jgi:hypothetical protein